MEENLTRLAKRLSVLGLCSRREAEVYIEKGWVSVNGEIIREKGHRVKDEDIIKLDEKASTAQQDRVTVILNKPVGYVSGQPEDGYKAAASLFTAHNQWEGDTSGIVFHPKHHDGLAPAGRLDIDSQGLLILTQNGVIAKQLIGENTEKEKEYLVRVSGKIKPNGLALLNHGLSLDGKKLQPAKVVWQNEDQLNFKLKEGKKRQIRRMCEQVGLKVVGLKRIRIGKIKLGNLPVGKWRYLRSEETF
jgi:23S rRNA pseudouridine2604 synthase